MKGLKNLALVACVVLLGFTGTSAPVLVSANSGDQSRSFPETGKEVKGKFLQYWDGHGGLAQQGYPISSELQELSPTDGKTYTVQYFERAVFELHPEQSDPRYQVLLSLLGNFSYKEKYPDGAPGQKPSTDNALKFEQTGHSLGGKFRTYWEQHGGLAQQGYPISCEFQEVSALDGKTYTVQYFERAVFELHRENAGTQYEVLLSQLGTYQYKSRYLQPSPTPTQAQPALTAEPTSTPIPALACPPMPADEGVTIHPRCVRAAAGVSLHIMASGFAPYELVVVCVVKPNESGCTDRNQQLIQALGGGYISKSLCGCLVQPSDPLGVWTVTMEGPKSGHKAKGYFAVVP